MSADRFNAFVQMVRGRAPDPLAWDDKFSGFEGYIASIQLQHFTPDEFVTVRRPDRLYEGEEGVRPKGDSHIFLPRQSWWPRAAALGIIIDEIRAICEEPVVLANWFRPPRYNSAVGGAEGSRHVQAAAVDIDLASARSCSAADRVIKRLFSSELLEMGVGSGKRRRHIDIFTRTKQTRWKYGG